MSRDPRQPLPPGTRFASYRIDSVLGAGGAAITYAATNLVVHRRVAIKEYLPIGLAQRVDGEARIAPLPGRIHEFREGLGHFVDEARTLAGFRHPAVAPIEHYIQANGTAYVVMPYVEGETLAARLRARGHLTLAEVDALLPPLLDALAAVHASGLVHGDLKPANIILQAPDRPVLIDFGSARQAGDAAHGHGSPGYAAPEIYRRRTRATPASDIYALGAILYRALTGRAPPDAPDRLRGAPITSAFAAGLRRARLPLLDAIDRALMLEAARRPGSIPAFRALLERDPAEVARNRGRRGARRTAWAGAAAAVVLAGAFVLLSTTDLSRDGITRRPLPPVAVRTVPARPEPAIRFRDCAHCPLMRTVPGRATAIAVAPVTRAAFARFVAATGHSLPGGCVRGDGTAGWLRDPKLDWRAAAPGEPVACVNWRDARDYTEWLTAKTGRRYRLPTADEVATALAARPVPLPRLARRLDRIAPGAGPKTPPARTAPAPTPATPRVAEWTADCWARDHGRGLYCPLRMVVGWRDRAGRPIRTGLPTDLRHVRVGFRVVRGAPPASD